VLLDFANRAFEFDVALKVLTPERGPIVEILNKIGVPTAVLEAPEALLRGFKSGSWYHPTSMLGMLRWSRDLKVHSFVRDADIVYTIAFRCHQATSLARLHPIVWHLHQFPPEGFGAYWRSLARRVPDALIANSQAVREAWEKREKGEGIGGKDDEESDSGYGIRDAISRRWRTEERELPISVIHNGVNLDRFKPRERTYWIHDQLGIPREHRLIGMPAVFARWKGHFEVLEAFHAIRSELPDVHLVIVGGSIYQTEAEEEYGQELRRVTGEFRVMTSGEVSVETGGRRREEPPPPSPLPNVHMLPFQREIELAYPEFDLAVHYSVRPEPFGRVILEAMACEVPIVAAGEAGPLEILGDGIGPRREGGWLAEPRKPEELARIFQSALSLPTEVLKSIGTAGRERAEDHFSSRTFAATVADQLRATARTTARSLDD